MKLHLITLVFNPFADGRGNYEASSKAPADVTTILKENYCIEEKFVVRRFRNKLIGPIELFFKFVYVCFSIPKDSVVFIQYPMVNIAMFKYCVFFLRKFKTIAIVHDLPSYRFDGGLEQRQTELKILNSFDYLIVHSKNMKNQLTQDGVVVNINVLEVFDYLLSEEQHITSKANTIVFAGALHKSKFLCNLCKVQIQSLQFYLYGMKKPEIQMDHFIEYKGAFTPDNVSSIEGEWGLLWDGDSIDDCTGNFGKYLKIIAPHKFSLYLACGLKVIVWEKSAMADFVRENHLGITIKCLAEIQSKLNSLTEYEISDMEKSVAKISSRVRKGDFLKKSMSVILEEINCEHE